MFLKLSKNKIEIKRARTHTHRQAMCLNQQQKNGSEKYKQSNKAIF